MRNYKLYIRNKKILLSIIVSVLLLAGGIIVSSYAVNYATEKANNAVTDIILDNIKIVDVDILFLYAPIIFWLVIIIYLFFSAPNKIPFVFKSIAIFLFIRSLFIILTHIGPFPGRDQFNNTGLGFLVSGKDLFFSSHTGLPFLMALVFWDNKYLKFFCLFSSVFFAVIVLLGHIHYSIDVLGAFFITYTIFHISEKLFKKDRQIFLHGLEN